MSVGVRKASAYAEASPWRIDIVLYGEISSERLRKSANVNQIAYNVRIAKEATNPINCGIFMKPASSWSVPAVSRLIPSITVNTSSVDESK